MIQRIKVDDSFTDLETDCCVLRIKTKKRVSDMILKGFSMFEQEMKRDDVTAARNQDENTPTRNSRSCITVKYMDKTYRLVQRCHKKVMDYSVENETMVEEEEEKVENELIISNPVTMSALLNVQQLDAQEKAMQTEFERKVKRMIQYKSL